MAAAHGRLRRTGRLPAPKSSGPSLGRQIVASYLVNDLNLNWILGARYFESKLLDYDVSSNWCNWAYIAGVGNDSRKRYFNISKQQKVYDPHDKYIEYWLSRRIKS